MWTIPTNPLNTPGEPEDFDTMHDGSIRLPDQIAAEATAELVAKAEAQRLIEGDWAAAFSEDTPF